MTASTRSLSTTVTISRSSDHSSSPRSRQRRLSSALGIVPLGLFVLVHLLTLATSLRGQEPFQRLSAALRALPALRSATIVLLLAVMAFHATASLMTAREHVVLPADLRSTRLLSLLKWSGLGTLAFVLWHAWEFPAHEWFLGASPAAYHTRLVAHLSDVRGSLPWNAIVYLLGTAATTVHLASGLWGFLATWGHLTTPRKMRAATVLCWTVGVAVYALSSILVVHFATGYSPFPFSPVSLPALPSTEICAPH